jgi:hypothetical protein
LKNVLIFEILARGILILIFKWLRYGDLWVHTVALINSLAGVLPQKCNPKTTTIKKKLDGVLKYQDFLSNTVEFFLNAVFFRPALLYSNFKYLPNYLKHYFCLPILFL